MLKQINIAGTRVGPCQESEAPSIPFRRYIEETIKQKETGTVLSVYGRKGFNKTIKELTSNHGVQCRTTQHPLSKYRSKTLFDLLIFALCPRHSNNKKVLEELCHCRMLLKPGAPLFLIMDSKKDTTWGLLDTFFAFRKEYPLLRHTGFIDIRVKKSSNSLLLSGHRPWQRF